MIEKKCPESIEELQELEKLIPLCKIELYNQAKARIKTGAAKSVSEASRQLGEETGRNPDSIRQRIIEEENRTVHPVQLSELSGTDKHRPEIKKVEQAILKTAKEIKTGRRKERQEQREEQKAETNKKEPPLSGGKFKLILDDFRNVDVKPNSIDAIITDPPYGIEFIPLYKDLSAFASKVLKPNAPCIVMIGQSWLEKALSYLSENLTYVWTLAYFSPGKSTQIFPRKIKSNWKPVIFLVNGKNECEHISDFVNSGHYDKQHHDWGQTVEGMAQLVEKFSIKGDLILDPFCGAGTTGVAAIKLDRFFMGIDTDEFAIKQTGKRLR